ncbi:MAG: hypothetical protein A7316_03440 [Candidatus Altiarchaeales archaeon WOR_SM1_86-2]|nr:MAG: hypothetical protein A7316_03440 [Candidatus Altiarchaeales archaeon WOR_SM1_86-2]
MVQSTKTFRIFVSSTFTDLKEERNALQKRVFPRLRELCMQHGYRFQVIDLRWGVREEAALDQQTMKICMEEINRCQKVTPRPNFIVLLGDRYGWRPLPYEIPAKEFEEILRNVSDRKSRELLAHWYRRDDNALPPVYCLQPRTDEFTDSAKWEPVEHKLRSILLEAIKNSEIKPDKRVKYTASATEQEIIHGLKVPDANEHVFCFFRKIKDLPLDPSAKDFIDMDKTGNLDGGANKQMNNLKECLSRMLPGNVHNYEAKWTGSGVTTDHLDKLCENVYNSLSRIILEEVAKIEEVDPLEKEISDHETFGKERARFFTGRTAILQTIADYIKGDDRHPLAVFGASGTGKTALTARAVKEILKNYPNTEVVFRFIGATPRSSDGRALLESLCRQISRRYGADESTTPAEYRELVQEFQKRLALSTQGKPLIVFLDALDQLSDANNARNLLWLSAKLPEHVRLIVSTLPGECLSVLEGKLPETNRIEMEPMPLNEGSKLLGLWFEDVGRTLQDHQWNEVLDKFAGCGLPLYLKLAFEEARRWKSYTKKTELSSDIPGIICDLFERLSSDTNHGRIMVSRSLGYLAAAKNGLSEDEMLDVLSLNEDVFQDFIQRAYYEPPEKRLPVVVWSRLYFDMEPYLTERDIDGTALLTFYHQQLGEAIARLYLAGDYKLCAHRDLAEYFRKNADSGGDRQWIGASPRSLNELPFHLLHAYKYKELESLYTDFIYLEAICSIRKTHIMPDGPNEYFGIFDLLSNIHHAVQFLDTAKSNESGKLMQQLQGMFDLLVERNQLVRRFPKTISQEIINYTDRVSTGKITTSLRKSDIKRLKGGLIVTDKILNTPPTPGHSSGVTTFTLSPSGKHFLSGGEDGCVGYWQVGKQHPIWIIGAHKGVVTWVALSKDGRRALSTGDDGRVLLWDVKVGMYRQLYDEYFGGKSFHWPSAEFCTFLDDESILVSRAGACMKIDILSGYEVWRNSEIFIHVNRGYSTCRIDFSPCSNLLIVGGGHKKVKVCAGETGEILATLQVSGSVAKVALSSDGNVLIVANHQGYLTAYDPRTGMQIDTTLTKPLYALCRAFEGSVFFAYDMYSKLHRIVVDDRIHIETKSSATIESLRYHPPGAMMSLSDNKRLIFGQKSGALTLFDWDSGSILQQWEPGGSLSMGAIYPGGGGAIGVRGTRLAGHAITGNKILFILPSGIIKAINKSPHTQAISGVAVIEANLALTVDKDGTAVIWQGSKAAKVHTLAEVDFTSCTGWQGTPLGIGGTQDDKIAVLGKGDSVKEFSLPSNTYLDRPGISALAVAGKPLSVFSVYHSGEVSFFREEWWRKNHHIREEWWRKNPHTLMGTAAALDPQCNVAASGNINGEVLLWRCSDGELEAKLTLHQGEVTALVFTEDATVLYTAGSDRFIYGIEITNKRIIQATLLPAQPIALLAEPDGWLTALDVNCNIYRFATTHRAINTENYGGDELWKGIKRLIRHSI